MIQHGQVTANQTDFPVLITNDSGCLPSEMVTSGGGNAAQSDGGDIRFSSDSLGATQLPCEVAMWSQNATASLAKAELWVKVSISSSVDTTIYVWYNAGGGQTQPAASSTYGSQNVWDSNYIGVYHLADGTTLALTDSTASANTLTNHNVVTAAAGKIDGGGAMNANSSWLVAPYLAAMDSAAVTFSVWVKSSNTGNIQDILRRDQGSGNRNFLMRFDTGNTITLGAIWGGNSFFGTAGTYVDGVFHLVVGVINGGSITLYVDGSSQGSGSVTGNQPVSSRPLYIGQYEGVGEGLTGSVDEIRYSKTNRSSTWIATEYNNQNAPASFVVAGTPFSTGGGGGGVPVLAMMHYMRMRKSQ